MPIPVSISFTAPDPDVAPATFADAVAQLNTLVAASINETITNLIVGFDVPAVEDQDKVWIRKNSLDNPVGTYTFTKGVWVREEPPFSARFGIFHGDPTDLFDADGAGIKGPGPIAGEAWGWHLLNGNNGVQNWSNKFLIAGAMDNDGIVGYDANWRTIVNGEAEAEGGVSEIFLDVDSTYFGGIEVGRHDADGSGVDDSGPLYGTGTGTTLGETNTEPIAISVVPPFIATAFIVFTGYVD